MDSKEKISVRKEVFARYILPILCASGVLVWGIIHIANECKKPAIATQQDTIIQQLKTIMRDVDTFDVAYFRELRGIHQEIHNQKEINTVLWERVKFLDSKIKTLERRKSTNQLGKLQKQVSRDSIVCEALREMAK